MVRVSINPTILKWARERAGYGLDAAIAGHSPEKIAAWESGEKAPTLSQLRNLAEKYHRSALFFTLHEPLDEPELADFRAAAEPTTDEERAKIPALRAFVYSVEARCNWATEFRREQDDPPPGESFIGSAKIGDNPAEVGAKIRRALGVETKDLFDIRLDNDALQYWIGRIESLGVFVFQNDAAGKKGLPTKMFRGLAIADTYAPAVAINSQDAPRGKIFTLAHELAHLWIGRPGISNSDFIRSARAGWDAQTKKIESFCNDVAAEALLPRADFLREWDSFLVELNGDKTAAIGEIAKKFHLSRSVVAVRAKKIGKIDDAHADEIRQKDYEEWLRRMSKRRGGRAKKGDREKALARQSGRLFSLAILHACRAGEVRPPVARELLGAKRLPQLDAIESYWQSGAA